jgi:adenylate cyclase
VERPLTDRAQPPLRWTALALVALAVATALAAPTPLARWFDDQIHDALTRVLPAHPAPVGVTLVDIDERSVAEIGPWPWPRPVLARLVDNLRASGARLQIWDLVLPESAAGDQVLADAMRGPGGTAPAPDLAIGQIPVLDVQVKDAPAVGVLSPWPPAPALCSDHAAVDGHLGIAETLMPVAAGHIAATPDADGRLRHLPAVVCAGGERYAQLALAVAALDAPADPWRVVPGRPLLGPHRWLERGEWRFALDEQGWLRVPYFRPHTAWPAVSAVDLLRAPPGLPTLRGHIVIVGGTAFGLADTLNTPLHGSAPGVSVHAELVAAGLQRQALVAPSSRGALAAAVFLGCALLLLPVLRASPAGQVRFGAAVAAALAVPAVLVVGMRFAGHLLPLAAPAAGLLAAAVARLLWHLDRQRRQVREMADLLGSFLPPGLAVEIARRQASGQSLGKPCQGVLLGVQVAGLERWCSATDTLRGLGLIHAIHTVTQRQAQAHGGTIEHVQGELLVLGWPLADTASARAALDTARALHAELGPVLARNEQPGFPLAIAVAIEAGDYLLGVVGASDARRPVLLGPAAHDVLALLSMCEELASPILVGPAAAELVAAAPAGAPKPPAPALQSLGNFLLPDQPKPRTLYRAEP